MMSPCPITHYTPRDIAEQLLKDIHFNENDITLEPCKGLHNNFYDFIPYEKDWCEIDEGRDIFSYNFGNKRFTKIITNPPYLSNEIHKEDRKNIAIKVIEKCFELCDDECWFLLNNQMFNSITPARLRKYQQKGFSIVFMRILNISCWYGRYYWICFKKNSKSIIYF